MAPAKKRTSAAARRRASIKNTAGRKPVGRKPVGRKPSAAAKAAVDSRKADRIAENEQLGSKVKALVDKGASVREAAEKLGVTTSKAQSTLLKVSTSGKDRIVGTDAEIKRQVIAARGEGVTWPELVARTGRSAARLRQMLGGAGTGRKPSAKRAARKPAKKRAAKKPTTRKAAPRGRRSAKKAATTKATSKPSGQPQGTRAHRMNMKDLLETVQDPSTSSKEVTVILEGRKIEVKPDYSGIIRDWNGKSQSSEHVVVKVMAVEKHKEEGRVIEFIDENKQTRFAASREIAALR